jgi:sterol desaturase/sphingolipid hydroxylase (fatty acid hydroxylase superfamily)
MSAALHPTLPTIAAILGAMAIVALVEAAIPLHPRNRWNRAHLGPNLSLTFITFATNALLNAALVLTLMRLDALRVGLLHVFAVPTVLSVAIVVVALDLAFYLCHVAMHKVPVFWRCHRVHHSDPAVDVTTSIRQHPGESVIRYAFMAAVALPLGAPPAAFAVYRVWSALNGLLEHANVRVPAWLDRLLGLVTTWPNLHKIHHDRRPEAFGTNYGNIFSIFDRIFGSFTPVNVVRHVPYGLDGFDDRAVQTTVGLLALPFRDLAAPSDGAPGESIDSAKQRGLSGSYSTWRVI